MSRWYVLYLFQEFRRALVQMFADNDDQDCVFMECSKNLRKHPHMLIECIPLERELGDMAPIYFKVSVCSESLRVRSYPTCPQRQHPVCSVVIYPLLLHFMLIDIYKVQLPTSS